MARQEQIAPMIPRYNRFEAGTTARLATESAMTDVSLISVADDDESLRESLEGLLKAMGYFVSVFSSAESFLSSQVLVKTDCLP
jgi:hypothetical protein